MKKPVKIFIYIGLSVLALVWFINYKPGEQNNGSTTKNQSTTIITNNVIVTDKGSATIYIPSDRYLDTRRLQGRNLTYIKHFNGGERGGGWDEEIPPLSKWRELGFTPKDYGDIGTSISFSLPKGEDGIVEIECLLIPKEMR